jgi:hypothetical protein
MPGISPNHRKDQTMATVPLQPILALALGILILIVPRFLNYFVAAYLIVVGIMGLAAYA